MNASTNHRRSRQQVRLASPGRLALASLPVLGFFLTPFLPFAVHPTLWFGIPAVIVWFGLMVALTVLVLQIADWTYRRDGGDEIDRAEELEASK